VPGRTHRFSRVERVLGSAQILGESPVWCGREQALYWVDLRAPALHRWEPTAGRADVWPMPELTGAVVAAQHSLLLALESGIHRFEPATGERSFLVAPEAKQVGRRMNDTKTDRCGRLWTSTMRDFGADGTGSLYRMDSRLNVERMLTGLRVPNALAWSPDDRMMYFADTSDGRLRGYEFDRESGRVGGMHILVEAGVVPGNPDGATVDADGCIWSARYGGGCVARITPRGGLDRLIELPVSQPTSCAFGDADLRTLYITSARQRLSDAQLRTEPFAGALFAVRLEVGGLPEPECAV
jgi:sugar lactone lactonase YvrE